MSKLILSGLVGATGLLLANTCEAQTATPSARSEIPIREVVLSDGTRRYGVTIKVGGTAIEAGLDTGSTGLRVLPGVLADGDAQSNGDSDRYSYESGTEFSGEVGTAGLTIGALSAPATLQLIKTVGCKSGKECPADKVAMAQFGIQGDGLAGEGFKAILGINMARADVANPFVTVGATRWIIELPRPNSGVAGKIVLNPGDDEVKDFAVIPVLDVFRNFRGGLHDSVPGCILNDYTKLKACGALLMDTGAPGIVVNNGGLGSKPWPDGTSATLAIYSNSKLTAIERITIGLRSHGSHLSFGDNNGRNTQIMTGLAPYFAFDVLYDSNNGAIGVKARPPTLDSPVGTVFAEKPGE